MRSKERSLAKAKKLKLKIWHKVTVIVVLALAILVFVWPSALSWIANIPLAVVGVEKCQTVQFYVDEQVIYDDSKLEGYIKQVQDKQFGKKQHCWSYAQARTITTVIEQPVPSIVRVGTLKFKDPALMRLIPYSGIKSLTEKEPVSIYYVDDYTDHLWSAGQYSDYKKAITVKSNQPLEYQSVILAHEYLHYVWYRDNLSGDRELVDALTEFYSRSSDLRARMVNYTDEMRSSTEFFSYACTEWSSSRIGPTIESHCANYIDRSKIKINYW